MEISDDSDVDVINEPKFNSTALLDERQCRNRAERIGEALNLSPILNDQTKLMNSSNCSFLGQNFDHIGECSNLTNSCSKFKNETSPPVRSNARSSRACVREEATASNSRNFFGSSIQVQNSSTMPSRITNPFDSDITRSMQTITLSPSLFDHPKNSDDDDGDNAEASFRWSIGQIAELRPANIDETQLLYQTPDPVQEAQIHSAIDKFWATQKYIVPSPQVLKESGIRKSVASPSSLSSLPRLHLDDSPDGRKFYHQRSQSKRSVEIQTMFTFPPNLDLVGLLGNCFQYEEGAVAVFEANLSLNTLRQKLFTDTVSSRTESSSSDKFESHVSSILFEGEPPAWYHSDDEIVPLRKLSIDDATDFDEKEISNRLSSPDLSPIKK